LGLVATSQADGSPTAPPTLDVGYLDFTYGPTVRNVPTAFDPESKLWWADGFWWGSMWNDTAGKYHIYRLNWGTQVWEDTGVPLDDRSESRADARFDVANNKLYVASHWTQDSPGPTGVQAEKGRVYRYSYNTISKTATMVIEKDNSGRLWTTYVSKPQGGDYQVYVNATTRAGLNRDHRWSTPFSLGDTISVAHVSSSDIASVVNIGDEVAVVWTNQISGTLNFAIHGTGSAIESDWTHYPVTLPFPIDNHLNVKSLESGSSGQIFAATKLQSTPAMTDTDPLIGMVTRDTGGAFSWHTYSTLKNADTRPLVMIDDENNKVYIFVSGKANGGKLCYKSATITSPLSNIQFAEGNCGTTFIDDAVYDNFNSATSSKQNVNNTTGIAVLASDDLNGDFYAHNVIGDPPPVVTSVLPEPGAIEVSTAATIKATFSKNMNASTLNAGTFTVVGPSGAVAGTISYDSVSRTATFAPTSPLQGNAIYNVTLTTAIQDISGKALFSQKTWSFSTDQSIVHFETPTYSANEADGNATITVTLDSPSGSSVTVDYNTSDGTAIEPGDYAATSGTLTFPAGSTSQTFAVNIVNDATGEDNETVNLALSNANNAQLGPGGDTATLTIVDNEGTPSVQFNPTSINADEGDGTATITVTLSHASAFAISVDYATGDGTASDGFDYVASNGTLDFAAGVTSQSFAVAIIEDDVGELNETVMLTLTNPSSTVVLGIPDDKATLTILDNDASPTVQFESSAYSTAETGSATITVTLSGLTSLEVTVDYATSVATATPGADYTATSGTLTFAPGDTSKTFAVAISDDSLDEADETVNLILSDLTNANPGSPVNAVLTIVDDDLPPTIQFSSATYDHVEDSGSAAIIVTLSAPSGQTVAVDYATSDGTATAPGDYAATSGTLEILAGEMSGTFSVPIVADQSTEFDETLELALSNPDDATLGSLTSAILTIIDDDGGLVLLPLIMK
jgi:hypothetical protein